MDFRKNDLDKSDLLLSVFVAAFLAMLLSHNLSMYITEPIMRDQSVFTGSRYTITVDALDTIAEDDEISIVAIGSSMTYKGIDGQCIGESLGNGITAYNLAQPSSKPYTDMQHIPRLISANPDVVLIEIAPDILSTPSGPQPYIQLRYTLDSIYQDNSDLGGWVDIVPPEYRQHVAMNDLERMEFRQEYVPGAIEEQLNRLIFDVDNGRDDGAWAGRQALVTITGMTTFKHRFFQTTLMAWKVLVKSDWMSIRKPNFTSLHGQNPLPTEHFHIQH